MSEILEFQSGREARMKGCVRDRRRNADWLRGWDQEQRDIERWEEQQESERAREERCQQEIAEMERHYRDHPHG